MTNVGTIGLDIAKSSFSLHGFDAGGRTVLKKTVKRAELLKEFAGIEPCRVGLEACGGAHHWGRELKRLGHEVRLIPPSRVKAFAPRQKNDAEDARAIARAAGDPEMRLVALKSVEQQSRLMLFKARDLLVRQRTQLLNALRGHFSELGIVVAQGGAAVFELVDRLRGGEGLPRAMRAALLPLAKVLNVIGEEIARLDRLIAVALSKDKRAQRLEEIPGFGALGAVTLSAAVPDAGQFSGGREFAAWLGLVPRQHSTGGKTRLGGVSKMGNGDLRRLIALGAIAVAGRVMARKRAGKDAETGVLGQWAGRKLETKPFMVVALALANKLARIAWAVLAGADYDANHGAKTAAAGRNLEAAAKG